MDNMADRHDLYSVQDFLAAETPTRSFGFDAMFDLDQQYQNNFHNSEYQLFSPTQALGFDHSPYNLHPADSVMDSVTVTPVHQATIIDDTMPSSRSLRSATKTRRTPIKRKKAAGGNDKAQLLSLLTGPLSEITKDSAVPIKDMAAHINRPAAVRRQEADRKGKVPRPMNTFVIYRSAYTERCKSIMQGDNHQMVSSLCGDSWKRETAAIKQQFARLGDLEVTNHGIAFPNYKYQPNKAGKRAREIDDDGHDADEPDLQNGDDEYVPPRTRRSKRARTSANTRTTPPRPSRATASTSARPRVPQYRSATPASVMSASMPPTSTPQPYYAAQPQQQYMTTLFPESAYIHQAPVIVNGQQYYTGAPGPVAYQHSGQIMYNQPRLPLPSSMLSQHQLAQMRMQMAATQAASQYPDPTMAQNSTGLQPMAAQPWWQGGQPLVNEQGELQDNIDPLLCLPDAYSNHYRHGSDAF